MYVEYVTAGTNTPSPRRVSRRGRGVVVKPSLVKRMRKNVRSLGRVVRVQSVSIY